MASDHGSRIQYAAAADFYFVSEHGSEFLKTCLDPFVSGFYYDEFFVGFDIGCDGSGPHVGFVAEDGIAHVIIVRHLYFVEQDDVLKFCRVTYDCAFADDRISADECALADFCVLSDDRRSVDVGCLEYGCGFGDPYVFADLIVFICRKGLSEFFDEAADLWKDFPWVGGSLEDVFCNGFIHVVVKVFDG